MPGRYVVYLALFTCVGTLVNLRLARDYLKRLDAQLARAEISAGQRLRKRAALLFWCVFLAAFAGHFFLGAFGLG